MNELINLFKHWSALEPERCEHEIDKEDYPKFKVLLFPGYQWTFDLSEVGERDLARMQSAVQRAIVSHDLRFSLENTADGLHFAAVRGLSQHSACLAQDKEPAIALLRAYLAWLEQRAEVAAGGEG